MLHITTFYQVNAINTKPTPKTGQPPRFPYNIMPLCAFDYYPDALAYFNKMKKEVEPGTRLELVQYIPQPVQTIEL